MCVAVPGKIKHVEDNMALIDYDGNTVHAHAGIADVSEGDYVLVHAGMIIQKLDEDEAVKMIELFKELEEIEDE